MSEPKQQPAPEPMRHLHLERPLVVFDLETTGIDPQRDRIVQIGLVRIESDGARHSYETLVDPGRPIPPGATAVHGITDRDVAGQPRFEQIVDRVEQLLAGADLAGYNSIRFDLPMLMEEMKRAGRPLDMEGRRHIDAMVIFHQMERRDLTAAYRFYCDRDLVGAHGALADATATAAILDAQLARYADLPRDSEGLDRFCNPDRDRWLDPDGKLQWNERGEAVLGFGRNRGVPLRQLAADNPSYLDWILTSDFSPEVKRIVRDARAGVFPCREAEPAGADAAPAPGDAETAAPTAPAPETRAPSSPEAPPPRPVEGELFPR